jgi:hypothetical protein
VLRSRATWPLVAGALLLAACSSNPQPGTPAPAEAAAAPAAAAPAAPAAQPAPGTELSGDWDVRIGSSQGTIYTSQLRLRPRADGYTGTMLPLRDNERPYFVRSAQVNGQQVVILLEAEDGDVRITAVLRPGNQLDGSFTSRTITGRFSAQRR